MDYQEIYKCQQVLSQKPKWLFSKDDIEGKLACLERLQTIGGPREIQFLFPLLQNSSVTLQPKVAQTIVHLFQKLHSLNDYEDSLKLVSITREELDHCRVNIDEAIYLTLVAIASFNSNGYVREKAVKELERLQNPAAIRFILYRLGDWVEQVRTRAHAALQTYLQPTFRKDFLQLLPTIDVLLQVRRVNLEAVHSHLIQFILEEELTVSFFKQLRKLSDKVRYRYIHHLLTLAQPTQEQLQLIARDRNFLVQLEILKSSGQWDTAFQKQLIQQFLTTASAKVKMQALYASKPFVPFFDDTIRLLLSDEAASVRELARYLMKDKEVDFVALYRERIQKQVSLAGSVMGLSEVGSREDITLIESHIHSSNSNVVIACLSATAKYYPEKLKQYALQLIAHPTKRVRDKSIDQLIANFDRDILERIRELYKEAPSDVKQTLLKGFLKIGGWSIVGDLILALTDKDEAIQNMAWEFLQKWRDKATRLFTTPVKADMERALLHYNSFEFHQTTMTPGRTKLWEELHFYIS